MTSPDRKPGNSSGDGIKSSKERRSGIVKPSDFPRDPKFREPTTPPFIDNEGALNLFSMRDALHVALHRNSFSWDASPYLPPEHNRTLDGFWVVDNNAHDRRRPIIASWFHDEAVNVLKGKITGHTDAEIKKIIERRTGVFELPELAYTVAARTTADLLGIDQIHVPLLGQLTKAQNAPSFAEYPSRQPDLEVLLWEATAKNVKTPTNNAMNLLFSTWRNNNLTDKDLLGDAAMIGTAGTDTTGTNNANIIAFLAEFGLLDEARSMLDDPDAVMRIVDETVRFGTPFSMEQMTAIEDVTFPGGREIATGTRLKVWLSAANRDPEVNGTRRPTQPEPSDPSIFDIHRHPNRHLGFGRGDRYCVGAELAKAEGAIFLDRVLRQLPNLELVEGSVERRAAIVDDLTRTKLTFNQKQAERIQSTIQ